MPSARIHPAHIPGVCLLCLCLFQALPVLSGDSPLGIPLQPAGTLPELKVLGSTEYVIPGEGRSVIVHKIEAPEIPATSVPAAPPPSTGAASNPLPSAAGNIRNQRMLRLSCTVHDGSATFVRWDHEGAEYRAWSNVNFHHFAGVRSFAPADGQLRYTLVMGIGDAIPNARRNGSTAQDATAGIAPPPDGEPGFVVVLGDPSNPGALAGMRALHDTYRREGAELKAAWERRRRTDEERADRLKAHPPPPQDITIFHSEILNGKSGAEGAKP